jgi:GNAT superfamily N-acetyltransferase
VRIEVVDPGGPAFGEWFAVIDHAQRAIRPDEPGLLAPQLRARLEDGGGPVRTVGLVRRDVGGRAVASGWVELPQRDNRDRAVLGLFVAPGARRRGAGTALLGALEALAAEEGRRICSADLDEPLAIAGRSAGRSFALARGYSVVLVNARRDLVVPLDPLRAQTLEARAVAASKGYRAVCFPGPWPSRWLQARAALGQQISIDAPLGATGFEGEVWDAERVRRHEALVRRQGLMAFNAVAVHEASGEVVAFSELWVPVGAPAVASQYDTVVARPHRGRRLSLRLKLANLRALRQRSARTRRVITYNALDNAPMIAVNEALGAVVSGHEVAWQRRLRSWR